LTRHYFLVLVTKELSHVVIYKTTTKIKGNQLIKLNLYFSSSFIKASIYKNVASTQMRKKRGNTYLFTSMSV
ncbi:hypothetical protein DX887_09710, partial [Vibrio alginolyticus]|nr:hypothetical protein [Vibrio alginolyticus]